MQHYDVVVVGGGPAGATVAQRAAQHGRKVCLLERQELPRYKACGGGLPWHIHKSLDFEGAETVEAVVRRAIFTYRGHFRTTVAPRGLKVEMVLRDRFDHYLVERAAKAGAHIQDGTAFLSFEEGSSNLRVQTSRETLSCEVLVGADGASSRVALQSKLRENLTYGSAISLEVEVPERELKPVADTIYFDVGDIPSGYAWIFPKRHQVSAGVCTKLTGCRELNQHLQRYRERSPLLKKGRVLLQKGAPLPFFRGWQPLVRGQVALVGDAGGLVDPLSGEGIHYAIESGKILGEALALESREALAVYAGQVEATLREDLEKAEILARAFFRFPQSVFLLGLLNPIVRRLFLQLIQGELSYRELYAKLDRSIAAKLFRVSRSLLFPRATKNHFLGKA